MTFPIPYRAPGKFGLSVLSLLLTLLLSGSAVAATEAQAPVPKQSALHDKRVNAVDERTGIEFVFEESLPDGAPVPLTEPDDCIKPAKTPAKLPRVAIIIDDMGHLQKMGGSLLDLDLNLTFSFLPGAPFTIEQVERAREMGRDILVHMPMEPQDPTLDPGPGALYLDATAESLLASVEDNLTKVPHAIGVNNHMGSKFTMDRQAMNTVLTMVRQKGLFFVDSLTTPQSLGADEARSMGIRTGRRHVFLDNVQTQEDICRQLKLLVDHARKHGFAIGIGHPNSATINALKLCRELLQQQVQIVGVSELVR